MPEIFDKEDMKTGLESVKEGIRRIRHGTDLIRSSVSNSSGDTYKYVELGLALIEPATQVVWQMLERFQSRFR